MRRSATAPRRSRSIASSFRRFCKSTGGCGSKVDYRILDFYELPAAGLGKFDVVLFLGVLYHLRHPLLALEIVCGLTTDVAIVESFVIDAETWKEHQNAIPTLEFYETFELGNQYDNWNGPHGRLPAGDVPGGGFRSRGADVRGRELRRRGVLPQVGTASCAAYGRPSRTALRVQRANAGQLFLHAKIGRVSGVRLSHVP